MKKWLLGCALLGLAYCAQPAYAFEEGQEIAYRAGCHTLGAMRAVLDLAVDDEHAAHAAFGKFIERVPFERPACFVLPQTIPAKLVKKHAGPVATQVDGETIMFELWELIDVFGDPAFILIHVETGTDS